MPRFLVRLCPLTHCLLVILLCPRTLRNCACTRVDAAVYPLVLCLGRMHDVAMVYGSTANTPSSFTPLTSLLRPSFYSAGTIVDSSRVPAICGGYAADLEELYRAL